MIVAADGDMNLLLALPRPDLYVICLELITAETVGSLFRLSLSDDSVAKPVLVLVAGTSEWTSRLVRNGLCVITRNRVLSSHLAAIALLMTAGYLPIPRDEVVDVPAHAAVLDERSGAGENAVRKLTRREREVFELARRGMTNPQIADALSIARSTVKSHIENILDKLGLRSRVEIILGAPSGGLP
ncbi:MAG: LuxR C-terminal-related transcriptional regulator [Actinomycetota bacterium]|nr:LuxR C-terminal-related transcriptional regulator [Actinomycetota bacterium]